MRAKVVFAILISILSNALVAQDITFLERTISEENEIRDFGEKLVRIALDNHPDIGIANKNSQISKRREVESKFNWLGNISVGGNINEASINPPADLEQNIFFPRYNFGVILPLSIFVKQPIETKIAKDQYLLSLEEKKKIELQIKKDVLTAYNNYLLRKDLYDMQVLILQEEQAILQSSENQFANSEISLEEFNNANRKYRADFEKLLTYRTNLNNATLELEQLIGVSLESVQ